MSLRDQVIFRPVPHMPDGVIEFVRARAPRGYVIQVRGTDRTLGELQIQCERGEFEQAVRELSAEPGPRYISIQRLLDRVQMVRRQAPRRDPRHVDYGAVEAQWISDEISSHAMDALAYSLSRPSTDERTLPVMQTERTSPSQILVHLKDRRGWIRKGFVHPLGGSPAPVPPLLAYAERTGETARAGAADQLPEVDTVTALHFRLVKTQETRDHRTNTSQWQAWYVEE